MSNEKAKKETTVKPELEVLTFHVKDEKNSTSKAINFDNLDKLTKQFAKFVEMQETACNIHCMGKDFKLAGKTPSNKGDRNFAVINALLLIIFGEVADKTIPVSTWVTKNLSTSFKVPALSYNAFKTVVSGIQGTYRNIVRTQRLKTEIMNKPVFQAKQRTQAELKEVIKEHKLAFPQLEAPKS